MSSTIGGSLGSTAAKMVYKNLGIILGMEIAKVLLTNLVSKLPGGGVLQTMISWLFGITQNIIAFIDSISSFLMTLVSFEFIDAAANLISLAGTSLQLIISVVVMIALANLFLKSVTP